MRRLAAGLVLTLPLPARAAELWVDTSLAADCADYDPATRSCGAGAGQAYRTLAAADAAAAAGDVVTLREATFSAPFVVQASGALGAPVVFRAQPGEVVRFTGIASAEGAILVEGRAWVELEGLTIEDVGSWIRVVDSPHVTIRGSTLRKATIEGTRGSVKLLRSDDCTIVGNTIDDGNDNVTIVRSMRARVLDNVITRGRHSLISVRCSENGVYRGNTFSNPIQKAVEVYDCEGSSGDDPVIFEATHRNLWEHNAFVGTAPSDQSHDYNAMQLAGQDGIIRRNIYRQNLGGGVHLQVYPEEALANHGNRVYHNTFYDNRCFGLGASSSDEASYYDNVVAANLLHLNADCAGTGEQISPGSAGTSFVSNTLAGKDPGFVDAAGGDLRLTPESPVIDAGPWLTRTVGAGRGTTLPVVDARYFFDGAGIPGEQGDLLQLAGDAATARVVAVDLEAQTLTLDAPLTWADDQGVALAYVGAAPDPGAFEQGLAEDPGGSSSGGEGSSTGAAPTSSDSDAATSGSGAGSGSGLTQGSAGSSGSTDAGTAGTGSAGTGAPGEGSGCACRGGGPAGAWGLLLLAPLRRRRRSCPPRWR